MAIRRPTAFQAAVLAAAVIAAAAYVLTIGSRQASGEVVTLDAGPLRDAYLIPDAGATRTTIYLVVQSGEVDSDETEGLVHYVEHLSWMTAVGPRGAVDRHSNAWTTQLATVFWLAADKDPEGIAAALARVLGPIDLPQPFMLEERGIVSRERDFRVGSISSDRQSLDDAMTAFLHADDPRARSVLGTATQIASFDPATAMDLHDSLYRPERAVLVIAGDMSRAAAEGLVRDAFGDIAHGDGPAPTLAYDAAPAERDVQEVVLAGASRDELHYGKVVTLPEAWEPAELFVALDLLYAILDSRLPGSLAGPLRYDATLAQGYSLSMSALDGSHVELAFDADPDRGVSAEDLLEALEGMLASVAATGIPEETFARVHEREVRSLERVNDPLSFTLDRSLTLIQMRQAPEGHTATLARLRGLDLDDLNRLLSAIAGKGRVSGRLIRP